MNTETLRMYESLRLIIRLGVWVFVCLLFSFNLSSQNAIPVCPLTLVTVVTDEGNLIANGPLPGNTDMFIQDGNGNWFAQDICSDFDPIPGTPQPTVAAPTGEIIFEELCNQCVTVSTCISCPSGTEYQLVTLTNATGNATGDMGDIELDGVKYGTFEIVFSDLDVLADVDGTQFGAFDNDGGTLLLRLDFSTPTIFEEFYIRSLEAESQVSIGTAASTMNAAAILSGLTITHCDGSNLMDADDITGGNLVTTASTSGCGANPNAVYTLGQPSVNTIYIKYHNPTGGLGCTFDSAGFRVGTCQERPPIIDIPTLSQWSLFILGLIIIVIGIVAIKQRIEKVKN